MRTGAPYHSVLHIHIAFIMQMRDAGETWISIAAQLRDQKGIQTTPQNVAAFWKRLIKRINKSKRINRPLAAARFQTLAPSRSTAGPAAASPAPIPDAFRPRPVGATGAAPEGGAATSVRKQFARVGDAPD